MKVNEAVIHDVKRTLEIVANAVLPYFVWYRIYHDMVAKRVLFQAEFGEWKVGWGVGEAYMADESFGIADVDRNFEAFLRGNLKLVQGKLSGAQRLLWNHLKYGDVSIMPLPANHRVYKWAVLNSDTGYSTEVDRAKLIPVRLRSGYVGVCIGKDGNTLAISNWKEDFLG